MKVVPGIWVTCNAKKRGGREYAPALKITVTKKCHR